MEIVSWDGNSINDTTNYVAFLAKGIYGLPPVGAGLARITGAWPAFTAIDRPGREFYIDIEIKGASLATLEAQLIGWFSYEDETPKKLIVQDDQGGGNNRYIYAVCKGLTCDQRYHYVAKMVIDGDIRFRENTPTTDTWSITATGQTKVLSNGGQDKAYPILVIEPTSGKTGGYSYKRWIPVRWNVDEAYSKYPVDICNNAFDTATLITATKMQSAGEDLLVMVDGVDTDRWLDGINTSTTKVWVNLDFLAQQDGTLDGAIGTGDTTIYVNEDISGFPSTGILMCQNEAITYTGKSNANKSFTGCSRGAKGTTAATHADTTAIWWVQHDIWILYGNSGAADRSATNDDDYLPAFELDHSVNTSWVYEEFGEDDGLRPGQWGGWYFQHHQWIFMEAIGGHLQIPG